MCDKVTPFSDSFPFINTQVVHKAQVVHNAPRTQEAQVVYKAPSVQMVIGHMMDHGTITDHKTNTVGKDHQATKWMTRPMTQQMTGPRSVHWTSIGPPGSMMTRRMTQQRDDSAVAQPPRLVYKLAHFCT